MSYEIKEKALAMAIDLAARTGRENDHESVLRVASKFETFLKGEVAETLFQGGDLVHPGNYTEREAALVDLLNRRGI